MHVHGALDIIMPGHTCCNQFKVTIDTCFFNTQPSGNTWFTPVHTLVNINGSVVDVDVDKLALCMDMQGRIPLMKQLTDGCSQSSVHTLFTDGDTW